MIFAVSLGLFLGLLAAVFSAIVFGAADFAAGEIGKKVSPFFLTMSFYFLEVPVLAAIVFLTKDFGVAEDNYWLFAIGILSVSAWILLIYGLTRGLVSVVMALTGLLSLVIPAIASVLIGEESSWLIWLGVVISGLAIFCVTRTNIPESEEEKSGHRKALNISLIVGILAGIFYGIYFVGLGKIDSPIMMKLLMLQLPGFIAAVCYIILRKFDYSSFKKYFFSLVVLGISYNLAQLLFPFSVDMTSLLIANIIVNMYPGVTIALAKLIGHEKTSRIQHIGFVIAIVGVILVSIGASI